MSAPKSVLRSHPLTFPVLKKYDQQPKDQSLPIISSTTRHLCMVPKVRTACYSRSLCQLCNAKFHLEIQLHLRLQVRHTEKYLVSRCLWGTAGAVLDHGDYTDMQPRLDVAPASTLLRQFPETQTSTAPSNCYK